jgi:hypothetical protein
MTWTSKQSTIGANTDPNSKKRGLTDSHLQCATTGTSQRKNDVNEVASLDGGYTALVVAAFHCELNEKDGTEIRLSNLPTTLVVVIVQFVVSCSSFSPSKQCDQVHQYVRTYARPRQVATHQTRPHGIPYYIFVVF